MFSDDNLHRNDMEMNGINGNGHWMAPVEEKPPQQGCCSRCCLYLARFLFWIIYLLTILLFLVFFILSAYQAGASVRDVLRYRDDANMFTIEVPNHKPLALYMQCTGAGKETILYENGLGDSVFLSWSFLPQHLKFKYRFCAYDRRGYGWSESYETDFPGTLQEEPQWSKTNIEFTKALIDTANLTKPLFYAGHSYGGHHLLYMALKYPHYIKGLIFLDASEFSPLDVLESMLPVLMNFHHTGLLRFAVETGLFDFDGTFSEYIPFNEVDPEDKKLFLASVETNMYFASFERECSIIIGSSPNAFDKALTDSQGKHIQKPVLVIDAGDRGDWFPREKFSFYEERFHITVRGSKHATLTHSNKYAGEVSEAIDLFIQHVTDNWNIKK